ncbi:MAG TPA: hypothetical protein VMV73_02375 [Candidatus Dormibacteraeota bacterium]|nr:hypothetical protein [Candidatus Dormibacteraeota bacterium]
MRRESSIDFAIYLRAVLLLIRHPAILVVPLLGALVSVLVARVGQLFTDPLGGMGGGIVQFVQQLVIGFAFAVAILYANDLHRGFRTNFDSIWEDATKKAGAILLATIGFVFVVSVASMVGSILGTFGSLALEVIAAFFLIYAIPAAAIAGLPGPMAISASIRAVRANAARAILLSIAFIICWVVLPNAALFFLAGHFTTPLIFQIVPAMVQAVAFAYLAFPFAKNYDDVAFRGF